MTGHKETLHEVIRVAARDKLLFDNSGGGVTLSGGEPLLQPQVVAAVAAALSSEGIHVAVDTCGSVPVSAVEALADVDLVLLDLKIADTDTASSVVGPTAARVPAFARELARIATENGGPSIWIRTPIIPGATDSEENIAGIGRFISNEMSGVVDRWELCAFNPLGREKYQRLGLEWKYADTELIESEQLARLTSVAERAVNGRVSVVATGLTRGERE
jgi:pyruvate formate lyase activating enzyme